MTEDRAPVLVDPSELLRRMESFAKIGGLPGGGLHRLTLSAEDKAARDHLVGLFEHEGFTVEIDAIGNMFGILELAGPGAPAVMLGSHLDSQPTGGRFDGQLGVVAALQAAIAVRDQCRRTGRTPRCNLIVVNWTNEEGARFQPSLLGSGVYTGQRELGFSLARRDEKGVSVEDALLDIGYRGPDAAPPLPAAYLELHIEQATRMEQEGIRLGAFVDQWGANKYQIAFLGEQAHTGPTPMENRRDALLAAAHLITAIRGLSKEAAGTLYTSVGKMDIVPNSPNTVPSETLLYVELRSPRAELLEWAEAGLRRAIDEAAASAMVGSEIRATERRSVRVFDAGLAELAEAEAAAMEQPFIRLHCATAHDGSMMTLVCPAIVLTVPCRNGITHHPDEFAKDDDIVLGTEHLARMLHRLCLDGTAPHVRFVAGAA
jgi:N-carbamoyl-L-amino-acid hydrolase